MDRRIRLALALLALTAPLWFGGKALSDKIREIYLANALAENAELLGAAASGGGPWERADVPELKLAASAAYSVLVEEEGARELFAQNASEPLPIASLAKLMTAFVAAERYEEDRVFDISPEAVATPETFGKLQAGDRFLRNELLRVLLLESSNDAAAALAEPIGRERFVERMNNTAQLFNLERTTFTNPSGLDPKNGDALNTSSARDIAVLLSLLAERHPKVFSMLGEAESDIRSADGALHHTAVNTNELLSNGRSPLPVLAGKTGLTRQAGGALALATEPPAGEGYLVHVVLGAEDRFGEMETLLDWILASYEWEL